MHVGARGRPTCSQRGGIVRVCNTACEVSDTKSTWHTIVCACRHSLHRFCSRCIDAVLEGAGGRPALKILPWNPSGADVIQASLAAADQFLQGLLGHQICSTKKSLLIPGYFTKVCNSSCPCENRVTSRFAILLCLQKPGVRFWARGFDTNARAHFHAASVTTCNLSPCSWLCVIYHA